MLQVEKVVYGQSDGVELQLAGGGTLRARRAVITVPLGVLKAGDITFEPPLPEEKTDAISSMGFGVLDKVQNRHPWPRTGTICAAKLRPHCKIRCAVLQPMLCAGWRLARRVAGLRHGDPSTVSNARR